MRPATRCILIAAAALLALGTGGSAEAQIASEMAREGRPALAVPIRVAGAQIREVRSSFMRKLAEGEVGDPVEVLDLAVEVGKGAVAALPPSLLPMLHIGGKAYPVQRIEYSNWDLRTEKPVDAAEPVGEIQTFHFFIADWQQLERGQLMILSVLSPEEIKRATDGQLTAGQLKRVLPELTGEVPRYAPQEFLKMGRGQ